MIISDPRLIDSLSLVNDFFADYDEIDLSDETMLNELSKVTDIKIVIKPKDNIERTIKELNTLIDKCPNLRLIYIHSTIPDSKSINVNDFINNVIDHNIGNLSFDGFNYNYLYLFNKLLSSNTKTKVTLDKVEYESDSLNYIFGDEKIRKHLSIHFFKDPKMKDLFNELRLGRITLENYNKYKDYLTNYKDLYISIGNVSEIDSKRIQEIKKDSHIKGIIVRCGYSRGEDTNTYSLEDYEKIRLAIDDIISKVKVPKESDLNRDKNIFSQIYKILGKNIRYDHFAISEKGRMDQTLATDCRNLKNGLLGVNRNNKKEFLAVCAGYATILQNICACFNIKCDYISSSSKEVEVPGRTVIRGPREYENGTSDPMGHGYNAVYLDGKAYFCDLTWDADSMKADNLGKYFLLDYDEFYKSHKDEGFSSDNVTLITEDGEKISSLDPTLFNNTCSYKEQIDLFGLTAKNNIDEMINVGYLADFATKNIEYIKQVKGEIGMIEYIKLIKVIHWIEDYIKSPNFSLRASWASQSIANAVTDDKGNVLGQKDFIFYPGIHELPKEDAINEVINMEESQWKMK